MRKEENSRFWKDVMLEDVNAMIGIFLPTHQFHKWVANSLIGILIKRQAKRMLNAKRLTLQ